MPQLDQALEQRTDEISSLHLAGRTFASPLHQWLVCNQLLLPSEDRGLDPGTFTLHLKNSDSKGLMTIILIIKNIYEIISTGHIH